MSLLQKMKSGMGSPDWNVLMVDIHLWKLLWVYSPGHARVKENDPADRLVAKATLASGLLLGSSKVLKNLGYYLGAQSQGHHTTDHLEERGIERGSVRQSSLKEWERAIINQWTLEPFQRQHWENFWEMGWSVGFFKCIDTILNWMN